MVFYIYIYLYLYITQHLLFVHSFVSVIDVCFLATALCMYNSINMQVQMYKNELM